MLFETVFQDTILETISQSLSRMRKPSPIRGLFGTQDDFNAPLAKRHTRRSEGPFLRNIGSSPIWSTNFGGVSLTERQRLRIPPVRFARACEIS